MEDNSGDKGNKKFLLIGIGILLVLGIFWVVNNVDFNEVGEKVDSLWEDYVGEDEEEIKVIEGVSNVSTVIQEIEVFTPIVTIVLIFSFIMMIVGIFLPIIFPKDRSIMGEEEDEDYDEEEEDDDDDDEDDDDEKRSIRKRIQMGESI